MSSRKHRIDPQIASPSRSRSRSQSQVKGKHFSRSKTNNTTTTNARLTGLEDLAQFDNDGMPFILVDGICTRNRQQLNLALSKCEKRRMKWIQRKCCVLPLLKYMKPAMRAEPMTLEEKDARAELEFDEDLKQLCITELTEEENYHREGTQTPLGHSASSENLLHNTPRLKEICSQLEELRLKQMKESPIAPSSKLVSPLMQCDRPKFLRQGTFDVKRDDRLSRTPFGGSKSSCLVHPISNSRDSSIGDRQLMQPRLSNSRPKLPKMKSSTCLFKNNCEWRKSFRGEQSVYVPRADTLPRVTTTIGDLQREKPPNTPMLGSLESFATCVNIRTLHDNAPERYPARVLDADRSQIQPLSIQPKSPSFLRLFKKVKN
ncbi:hypothetical protein KR215_001827 [Drosophila sulfurigaster]|nr:hypothetical protein KR215_001827 [Drosophila sulfurigaster]